MDEWSIDSPDEDRWLNALIGPTSSRKSSHAREHAPVPNDKRRYKPGLKAWPHVARQLRWFRRGFRRVFSWPIFGAIVAPLLIPSYPGQTKSSGVFEALFWVGCGTVGGLVIELLVRWREKRASQRLANGQHHIPPA